MLKKFRQNKYKIKTYSPSEQNMAFQSVLLHLTSEHQQVVVFLSLFSLFGTKKMNRLLQRH